MPLNMNYSFNFGVLLIFITFVQMVSGILLLFFYQNSSNFIFSSMIYLNIDIFFGVFLKFFHGICANFFFIFIFFHMLKGYFFSNMKNHMVFFIGFIIFFLLCLISFLGYVLPWGQMSLWGATVITNLTSVLPFSFIFIFYIWGDYSISNSTLLRFLSLHFFLPFILIFLIFFHIFFLHINGSSSSSFSLSFLDNMNMFPYFFMIDFFIIIIFFLFLLFFFFFFPFFFFESENFILANALLTPLHMKPEWYFLFPYAVLRVFVNKGVGVFMMIFSLFSLFFFYFFKLNIRFSFWWNEIIFIIFFFFILLLLFNGGCVVSFPFIFFSWFLTYSFYFFLFLVFFILYFLNLCLNKF